MNDVTVERGKGIEYVRCNLCQADDYEVQFTIPVRDDQKGTFAQDEWDIVRCNHCGLIYVNPRPDTQAFAAYHEFENPQDFQTIQDWFIDNADLQRPTWRRYLQALQRFGKPGRLLDVGCGAGTFLVEAQRAGYEVTGQEVAPYFVDYCRRELGLTVFEGEIETLPLAPGSLDYATAFDVIEHHPKPDHMLREMHRLLRPGGLIAISTHDIGNPFARRYGAKWRFINPIGHLTYFTRQTLAAMLAKSGFQVLYKGGIHTIDGSAFAELRNWLVQFLRVIVLRSLVIGLYMPLARRYPALTNWRLKVGQGQWDHHRLTVRAGQQIVMNDDMVFIARRNT